MIKNYLLIFLTLLFLIFPCRPAASQDFNYKVNAMYVYYFVKYINWPPSASTSDIITIGVLGDSRVLNELETITKNKKANKLSFVVKRIDITEIKKCQVVIVSKSETGILRQIRDATREHPVLVISEKRGMTSRGAEICIYVDDEDNFKTKFELSKSNMKSKGLKVSTELLSLADVVE